MRLRDLGREDPSWTAQMAKRSAELSGDGRPAFRHAWVPLDAIAPALADAVVAAEDSEFRSHRGIDWNQVRRALRQNLRERQLGSSASTITMQLAKNLYLSGEPSLRRKLTEAALAARLECRLSKRRVLELYLNVIEWGPPGLFGAEEAARHHFGVSARELSLEQSVELAAVIPICPAGFDPARFSDADRPARDLIEAKPLLRGRGLRIEHALYHGQGRGGGERLWEAARRVGRFGRQRSDGEAPGPPFAPSPLRSVACSEGTAALALLGGPDPRTAPALLDALAAGGLRATFFVAADLVRSNPGAARAISDLGHEVGLIGGGGAGNNPGAELALLEEDAGFVPRLVWTPSGGREPAAGALGLVPVSAAYGRGHAPHLGAGEIVGLDARAERDELLGDLARLAGEARRRELRLMSVGQCLALADERAVRASESAGGTR